MGELEPIPVEDDFEREIVDLFEHEMTARPLVQGSFASEVRTSDGIFTVHATILRPLGRFAYDYADATFNQITQLQIIHRMLLDLTSPVQISGIVTHLNPNKTNGLDIRMFVSTNHDHELLVANLRDVDMSEADVDRITRSGLVVPGDTCDTFQSVLMPSLYPLEAKTFNKFCYYVNETAPGVSVTLLIRKLNMLTEVLHTAILDHAPEITTSHTLQQTAYSYIYDQKYHHKVLYDGSKTNDFIFYTK